MSIGGLVHFTIPITTEDEAQAIIDKLKAQFEHPGAHGWYEQPNTVYHLQNDSDEEVEEVAPDEMTLMEAYDHFLDHLGFSVLHHIKPT